MTDTEIINFFEMQLVNLRAQHAMYNTDVLRCDFVSFGVAFTVLPGLTAREILVAGIERKVGAMVAEKLNPIR